MNAGIVRHPPFWSPDGRWVAFFSDGKLKRIAVAGGPAETLCDSGNLLGGTWTSSNVILFGEVGKGGIMQVPASGGTPVQRTQIDKTRGEFMHALPWALPDGRHFLYMRSGSPNITGVYVGSIDTEPAAQDVTRLIAVQHGVAYAAARDGSRVGHLLFLRDKLLMAQPFDEGRLELRDEPVTIAEQTGACRDLRIVRRVRQWHAGVSARELGDRFARVGWTRWSTRRHDRREPQGCRVPQALA